MPGELVYTDGYNVITREEFLDLQERVHRGDPVAYAHVVFQQRRRQIEDEHDASA